MSQERSKVQKFLLTSFSAVLIPFSPSEWNILEYSSLRANKVDLSKNSIEISVDGSASPLIHKLKKPVSAKKLIIKGEILGKLSLGTKEQGDKKADDFTVRIGLVVAGKKTMNFAQKLIAPSWINRLYDLADRGDGIDRIEFFNIAHKELSWKKRTHPLSDLMTETIIGVKESGTFQIRKEISPELKVIAIWLSSDGDDTTSSYKVRFDEISLE